MRMIPFYAVLHFNWNRQFRRSLPFPQFQSRIRELEFCAYKKVITQASICSRFEICIRALARLRRRAEISVMTSSLQIVDDELRCTDDKGTIRWSVAVPDIILIAEYTTNEGPMIDDYYLVFCFLDGDRAMFATCPFYATGREAAFGTLARMLGSPIQLGLAHSTDFSSRVLWPPHVEGQAYLTFKSEQSRDICKRLKAYVLGHTTEQFLSNSVQNYIRSQMRSLHPEH